MHEVSVGYEGARLRRLSGKHWLYATVALQQQVDHFKLRRAIPVLQALPIISAKRNINEGHLSAEAFEACKSHWGALAEASRLPAAREAWALANAVKVFASPRPCSSTPPTSHSLHTTYAPTSPPTLLQASLFNRFLFLFSLSFDFFSTPVLIPTFHSHVRIHRVSNSWHHQARALTDAKRADLAYLLSPKVTSGQSMRSSLPLNAPADGAQLCRHSGRDQLRSFHSLT